MKAISLVVGVLPAVPGFIASLQWWRASTAPMQRLAALPEQVGEGNVVFQTGEGVFLLIDLRRQAQLNRQAAGWTALAILLQTASFVVLSAVGS